MLHFLSRRAIWGPDKNEDFYWRLRVQNDFGPEELQRFDALVSEEEALLLVRNLYLDEADKKPLPTATIGKLCYELFWLEKRTYEFSRMKGFFRNSGGFWGQAYDKLSCWADVQDDKKKLAETTTMRHAYMHWMQALAVKDALAITAAVLSDSYYLTKDLLDYGANPNSENPFLEYHQPLLLLAVMQHDTGHGSKSYPEGVKLLLEYGADPHWMCITGERACALQEALNNYDAACLRVLLNGGANIHMKNALGISLYEIAKWSGSAEIFAIVENHLTGRPEAAIREEYNNEFKHAMRYIKIDYGYLPDIARSKSLDALKEALLNGANIEERDSNGSTALFYATIEERIAVIDFLLDSGAAVKAVNLYGDTALRLSVRLYMPKVYIRLLHATLAQSGPDELEGILFECRRMPITPSQMYAYIKEHRSQDLMSAIAVDTHNHPNNALSVFMHTNPAVVSRIKADIAAHQKIWTNHICKCDL